MLIAGFQKLSMIDYPGKMSAMVFTPYCNMRCTYCHNREILNGAPELDEAEIFAYLEKRKDMLDAVVISGGEPTMRPDLPDFIKRVRKLGYLVKLDTNGINFKVLRALIVEGLVDYVAMDIKAPFEKYPLITPIGCSEEQLKSIKDSARLLINGAVDYELRTTFAPQLSVEDIGELAKQIEGCKKYFLQQYRRVEPFDDAPHAREELHLAAELARELLGVCNVRE